MPRAKKRRKQYQSVDFTIGELKKIVRDKTTPSWIKIIALDRMAEIDGNYKVDLLPPTSRVNKLPAATAVPEVIAPEVEAPVIDEVGKRLLDNFHKTLYNGGANAGS